MTAHPRSRAVPGFDERPPVIEQIDPALVEVYRNMTVTERLAAAFSATALLRSRIEAHLRSAHPGWSEEQIRAKLARRWLSAAADDRPETP